MQGCSVVERGEVLFHMLIAGTLREGSTEKPVSSIADQRLQHKTLK